jgi:hypothetical protein
MCTPPASALRQRSEPAAILAPTAAGIGLMALAAIAMTGIHTSTAIVLFMRTHSGYCAAESGDRLRGTTCFQGGAPIGEFGCVPTESEIQDPVD